MVRATRSRFRLGIRAEVQIPLAQEDFERAQTVLREDERTTRMTSIGRKSTSASRSSERFGRSSAALRRWKAVSGSLSNRGCGDWHEIILSDSIGGFGGRLAGPP